MVFIPFHYGDLDLEESPNALMPAAWDPVSKQPLHKAAAVRIERADAGAVSAGPGEPRARAERER
ncbi:hypothetical protein D3C83_254450 [compost metagenome]